MSGYKHQFALLGAILVEREKILDHGRLAVFVGAQQGDVEVVAREVEIVRVAAEKCRGEFRRPYDTGVLETMIFVKVIAAAVIEVNHVAAGHVLVVTDTGGGQLGIDRILRQLELFTIEARRGLFHFSGDILDLLQAVQFDLGTFRFVFARFGEEAILDVILFGGRQLAQAGLRAMVIGHHQTLFGNERCRATAGDTHRTQHGVVRPFSIGGKAVLRLDFLCRQIIERPHPFGGHGKPGDD